MADTGSEHHVTENTENYEEQIVFLMFHVLNQQTTFIFKSDAWQHLRDPVIWQQI